MFANYLVSIISDEESTQEDKLESIKPLLQELNQNNLFEDEDKFSQELIDKWNQMKLDDVSSGEPKAKSSQSTETPTDTILSMINKHKTQIDTKKSQAVSASESCEYAADYVYNSEDENDTGADANDDIGENTNSKDAKEKERLAREKLAEVYKLIYFYFYYIEKNLLFIKFKKIDSLLIGTFKAKRAIKKSSN